MSSWSSYKNGSELPDTYAFAIYQKLAAGDPADLELFSQWVAKIINEESQVRSYEMESVRTGTMKYVLFAQVESYNNDDVYFTAGTKLIGINAVTAHKYLWKYQKTKKSRYGNYGPEGAVVREKSASDPAAMGLDPKASFGNTEKVSGASQADPNDVEYAKQHKQDTAHGTDLDSDREVSSSDTSTGLTVEQYITQALGPTAATACFAEDKTDYSASSNTSVTSGTSVTPSGTSTTPSGGEMPTDIGGSTSTTDPGTEIGGGEMPPDIGEGNGSLSFRIDNDHGSFTYLLYDTVTTPSYSKTDVQEKRYAIPSGILDSTYEATFGTATKCYAYEGKADAIHSFTQLKQQAFQQVLANTSMSQEQKENTAKVNNALYNGLIESVQELKEHWQCRMQVTVSKDTRYLVITTYYGYYNPTEAASTTTETTVDPSQPLKYEKEETKTWQYDIPSNTLAVTFEKIYDNNNKCFDFRSKADELAMFDQMAITFEEEMNASAEFGEEQRQNMITAYKTMYSGCKEAIEYLKEHWQCRIKCTVSSDTSKMIVTGYYGYYDPTTSGSTSGSAKTSSDTTLVKPIPPSIIMGIALAKTGTGEENKTNGKYNIWDLDYDKTLTTQAEVKGKCAFSSLKEAIEGILKWCHKQTGADQPLTYSIEKDSEDAKVTVTNNYLKLLDSKTYEVAKVAVAKLVQDYKLREWDHHSKVGAATADPSSSTTVNKIGVGVKRIVIGEAHAGNVVKLIKLPENRTNPAEPIYPDYSSKGKLYIQIKDTKPKQFVYQLIANTLSGYKATSSHEFSEVA